MNTQKKKLITIFSVILTDITGFGMVIPLTPILARDFGAEGLKVGLLISCYSMVQFLFAPFWGRLSDTFGRKNVILLGLFGSGLAHLLFAFSTSFNDIFISRLLAGFFGGNVVIATAYIADISSQQNRSKSLALIGMAFGAGFTIGPLLGFLFILFGGGGLGSEGRLRSGPGLEGSLCSRGGGGGGGGGVGAMGASLLLMGGFLY